MTHEPFHFTGGETPPDEIERAVLEHAVPLPEGYTHTAFCAGADGTLFIVVAAEGLPAMCWWPHPAPEGKWIRFCTPKPEHQN